MQSTTQTSKPSQWKLLFRVLKLAADQKSKIIIALVFTLIQSLLTALQPYLYKIIIDDVIIAKQFQLLNFWILVLVGWLMFQTILGFFNAFLSEKIAQNIVLSLRQFVYEHLIRLKLRFFDKTPVGTAVTRSVSDIQTITDLFSSGLITILGDLVQIIAILSAMIYISWKLTLATLLVIPLLMYSANKFRKGIRDTFQDVRNQVAALNAFLQERITGMSTVQIFNQEERQFNKFKEINKKHMDANIRSVFYYSIFFPIVEVLVAFAFAIIIGYGTILLFNSEIQLGSITAFIMFVNLFFRPIRAIADRFNNIQMGVVAAERIFNLIDNKDNVEVETQLNKPASFNREALRSSSPDFSSPENKITPNNLLGKIEFRNVHFRYNEGSWILNNLSFTVQPGESLALVGKTGSGKTSIASLITQLYQHEKGEILIDDLPITEYFLPALRKRIAFVLQDVFLFSGSIQNNLTLNDENLPLDNLIEISKQIGAFEFINALPGGFQYNVQERGMSLSTGQRQLISFIRALAANPDVIILDEATSSVDTQTEQMIQKAIELLLNNRTAIVIAHRLSTIRHCNTIMVLNQGEILERGSHETLMNQNGYYKELVNKHHTVEE